MQSQLLGLVTGGRLLVTANILIALAGGLSAAYWTWSVWHAYGSVSGSRTAKNAPSGASSLLAGSDSGGVSTAISAHLFGHSSQSVGAGGGEQSVTSLNLKLVGTFVGARKKPSYALIVGESGKPATYAKGAEISKGVVVGEIAADHVLLFRNGAAERLNLNIKAAELNLATERKDKSGKR